jgi:hypothetical protein
MTFFDQPERAVAPRFESEENEETPGEAMACIESDCINSALLIASLAEVDATFASGRLTARASVPPSIVTNLIILSVSHI